MSAPALKTWLPGLSSFAVALLCAASGVYWVLRWPGSASGPALPPPVAVEEPATLRAADLARLLGANPDPAAGTAPAQESSRFRLTGIVAQSDGKGLALLSVDGRPARPYRVGSLLDEGWVLQSVGPRSITLVPQAGGARRLLLELPRPQ